MPWTWTWLPGPEAGRACWLHVQGQACGRGRAARGVGHAGGVGRACGEERPLGTGTLSCALGPALQDLAASQPSLTARVPLAHVLSATFVTGTDLVEGGRDT